MSITRTLKTKSTKLFFFLLNDISEKFNAILLKKIVDLLFELSEKVITKLERLILFYIKYYDGIIEKEIEIAEISKSTKVVNIGCGSIPASSILIAQKTGANILGMDRDKHAVENAIKCVESLNLSDKIKIIQEEAVNASLKNFDVIILAQGISPKQVLLEQISEKITKDNIVILRSLSSNSTLDKTDLFIKKMFKILKIIYHEKHGSAISIALVKK